MADLVDLPSWKLDTGDLIQQIAQLAWLRKSEENKSLYEGITAARVVYELWNRVSGQRELELYQAQCIKGIVDYIQKHPKASEAELAKELTKQVAIFKEKVEAM